MLDIRPGNVHHVFTFFQLVLKCFKITKQVLIQTQYDNILLVKTKTPVIEKVDLTADNE
jgi:hypothetical protein